MSYLSSKVKSTAQNPRGAAALFHEFDYFKNNPATVLQVHLTYAFNSAGVNGGNLINPFIGHFDVLDSNTAIKNSAESKTSGTMAKKRAGRAAEALAKSKTQLFKLLFQFSKFFIVNKK